MAGKQNKRITTLSQRLFASNKILRHASGGPPQKKAVLDKSDLLYATPIKRGSVEVLEDCVPLYDIPVTLRTRDSIKSVKLIPEGKPVAFKRTNSGASFAIPRLLGHQMALLSIVPAGAKAPKNTARGIRSRGKKGDSSC